jgi:hypothetical protein
MSFLALRHMKMAYEFLLKSYPPHRPAQKGGVLLMGLSTILFDAMYGFALGKTKHV